MKLKNLLSTHILFTALLAAGPVKAAERFSVDTWGKSFESSLTAKDSKAPLKLLDFKALEKKAIPNCVDCDSKETLKKARAAFDKGQYDKSVELYNQIPKGSDYWFQAVEERGWAYYRQNEAEKALAQTKTLVSPQFGEVVNSEAYYLRSLTQLKICDYKGVFETTQSFKERQRERVLAVQALSEEGFNDAFIGALKKVRSFPLQASDVGQSLTALPVLYYKDIQLQEQMLRFKVSQKALEILRERGVQKALQAQLDKINQDSFQGMKARLIRLAKEETEANGKIIQKLNLVEVEAIQRIHTDTNLDAKLYSEGKFKKAGSDQLIFMDDGRPWIDELDKYAVAAKACPSNIRRKM